jgi:hypothetical protein
LVPMIHRSVYQVHHQVLTVVDCLVLGCSFETKGDTGHWGISAWWTGEEVEGCNIVGVYSFASFRIFLAIVLLVLSRKSHAFLFSCGVMSSNLTLCKFFIQLLMLSSWLINRLRFFSFWVQPRQMNRLVRLTLNSRLSSFERTLNFPRPSTRNLS